MKNLVLHTSNAEETIELGRKIGSLLHKGDILAMQGTLASGKTTITKGIAESLGVTDVITRLSAIPFAITKGIAESLGVTDVITSPTFCLISEYEGKMPLYHLDVYRLEGSEDFINLGTDDMLYGDGVSVIEWSEKIMDQLPKDVITIKLEPECDGSTKRIITISNWPYEEIN